MVYSICKVYLKWLKRQLVDRLMAWTIKRVKLYTEPSSDVSHHEFQCHACRLLSSFGDECAWGKNTFFGMSNITGHLDLTVFLLKVISSSYSSVDMTQATYTHKNSPSI